MMFYVEPLKGRSSRKDVRSSRCLMQQLQLRSKVNVNEAEKEHDAGGHEATIQVFHQTPKNELQTLWRSWPPLKGKRTLHTA
jgi:hypothetical protein